MSEEEQDDLSMPEEIGETDSQDEMYEHFSVTVDKGQGMLRIDKFLTNRMEDVSRNRIQAAADAGNILVGAHSRQVELQGQAARPHSPS